jgi:hypothetical protein
MLCNCGLISPGKTLENLPTQASNGAYDEKWIKLHDELLPNIN